MLYSPPLSIEQRLEHIQTARRSLLLERRSLRTPLVAGWVERSWQRCIQSGRQPHEHVHFDLLPHEALRRVHEANQFLLRTARPVMERLGQAIADTGYFAILTNADGIVVDVNGPIDRTDRRAQLITRIGVDLSEKAVGTTAIGTALAEHKPVWLHRGEHFFTDNIAYSCAGAPLMGPDGQCVGMLDLTGIDTIERPELQHLVAQTAHRIENALLLAHGYDLLLRVNWPGVCLGSDIDGLITLDAEGRVVGSNDVARNMLAPLHSIPWSSLHVDDIFGVSHGLLVGAARQHRGSQMVPLWSGLHVQVQAIENGMEEKTNAKAGSWRSHANVPLKEQETALIRHAVDEARGNVAQASKALGISRATVYRKLGKKPRP
jgi:sigma-54 dependent transcriptional regulator, acetoin dehydrogenase operon transcriptional activator AcoR